MWVGRLLDEQYAAICLGWVNKRQELQNNWLLADVWTWILNKSEISPLETASLPYDGVQNPCRRNLPGKRIFPSSYVWAEGKLKKGGDSRDTIPTPALNWMSVDVTSRDDWCGKGTYQLYRAPYPTELFPISVQHKAEKINDSLMSPSS
jgi:hypothetical protein